MTGLLRSMDERDSPGMGLRQYRTNPAGVEAFTGLVGALESEQACESEWVELR